MTLEMKIISDNVVWHSYLVFLVKTTVCLATEQQYTVPDKGQVDNGWSLGLATRTSHTIFLASLFTSVSVSFPSWGCAVSTAAAAACLPTRLRQSRWHVCLCCSGHGGSGPRLHALLTQVVTPSKDVEFQQGWAMPRSHVTANLIR
jgi:hypothetical protein